MDTCMLGEENGYVCWYIYIASLIYVWFLCSSNCNILLPDLVRIMSAAMHMIEFPT